MLQYTALFSVRALHFTKLMTYNVYLAVKCITAYCKKYGNILQVDSAVDTTSAYKQNILQNQLGRVRKCTSLVCFYFYDNKTKTRVCRRISNQSERLLEQTLYVYKDRVIQLSGINLQSQKKTQGKNIFTKKQNFCFSFV